MIECSHVKVHQWWPCKNIQTCLHTYINIYIYVYYGYKNLSTYLSYTAGTKRAAEASADGRAAASSWVPGFCVTQALNTKDSRFPQVMNKCLHVKSFGKTTVAM